MISPEFKAAINENSLLRTRIMLKDSLVLDPTFIQLDEMLAYARKRLPDLFVSFDGESLENNETKWDKTVMNEELVWLVTNFSEERLRHLRKVISKVLGVEEGKPHQQKNRQPTHRFYPPKSSQGETHREVSQGSKEARRHEALRNLSSGANKIEEEMKAIRQRGSWRKGDIDKIERAAREILNAVQEYKNNR